MVDPRSTAQKLARQFVSTFDSEVRSVLLFGSVARGEAIPGMSDINVLVLLDAVTASVMAKVAPLAQQWIRAGNTPPLVFSQEEWLGMRDTFAIEIADMQDAREVIYGDDPVSVDALTRSDLRLHTERELRQTLLNLRLRMLLAANHPRELGSLLVAGLPSFSAYMRAILRLAGERPATQTEAVFERTGAVIDADATPLLKCQDARRNVRPIELPITDSLVDGYLDFGRRLVTHVDKLP
jgi:Nucleotidyltransferase domain